MRTVYVMQEPDKQNVKDAKLAKADGIVVRVRWATVEPKPGVYNFKFLESELARAARMKKKVQLVPLCGIDAPKWLASRGVKFHKWTGGQIPLPWDRYFQSFYGRLAETIADRVDVSVITHVHSIGAHSAEWHYQNNCPGFYGAAGFSSEAMIDAHIVATGSLREQFHDAIIVVDLGDHRKVWTGEVIQRMTASYFGFQMNSMSAKLSTTYEGYTRIKDAAEAGRHAGFEMVGPSVGADGKPVDRFGGPFSEAVKKMNATKAQWEIRYQWDLER